MFNLQLYTSCHKVGTNSSCMTSFWNVLLRINGTERSPIFASLVGGMLDCVEDWVLDVKTH